MEGAGPGAEEGRGLGGARLGTPAPGRGTREVRWGRGASHEPSGMPRTGRALAPAGSPAGKIGVRVSVHPEDCAQAGGEGSRSLGSASELRTDPEPRLRAPRLLTSTKDSSRPAADPQPRAEPLPLPMPVSQVGKWGISNLPLAADVA